jgi:hypothetical protein
VPRRPFLRFLLSSDRIVYHLFALALIIILSVAVATGDADVLPLLIMIVIGYPIILVLLWWDKRHDEREARKNFVLALTDPDGLRRKRRRSRRFVLGFTLFGATVFTAGGHAGVLDGGPVPAEYAGYFLFAVALAGLAGVNIWHRGPLDPRDDPPGGNLQY